MPRISSRLVFAIGLTIAMTLMMQTTAKRSIRTETESLNEKLTAYVNKLLPITKCGKFKLVNLKGQVFNRTKVHVRANKEPCKKKPLDCTLSVEPLFKNTSTTPNFSRQVAYCGSGKASDRSRFYIKFFDLGSKTARELQAYLSAEKSHREDLKLVRVFGKSSKEINSLVIDHRNRYFVTYTYRIRKRANEPKVCTEIVRLGDKKKSWQSLEKHCTHVEAGRVEEIAILPKLSMSLFI